MSVLRVERLREGLYLPELGLWLDPHRSVNGPEKVFVSHAHSDHIARHREVILTEATARLVRVRLGGERHEHHLAFGQPAAFVSDDREWTVTLLPAGHILGSAMSLINIRGESLLYTGDFKLGPGLCAERCAPRHADTLIMETTFGRPEYRFPPNREVMEQVCSFCVEALDNNETPVLLGYSLGKSQEILKGLAHAGLLVVVHPQVARITRVYEELGQTFPPYETLGEEGVSDAVILCPPGTYPTSLRCPGPIRTAVLTGWAIDPGCRYRYGCDAAFPLSDHSDYAELFDFVRLVGPERIFTVHGFAADFAQALRDHGFNACALGEQEQLTLTIPLAETSPPPSPVAHGERSARWDRDLAVTASEAPTDQFIRFARFLRDLGHTRGQSRKINRAATYFSELSEGAFGTVVCWLNPEQEVLARQRAAGWALIRDALCLARHLTPAECNRARQRIGDSAETTAELLSKRPGENPGLSLNIVHKAWLAFRSTSVRGHRLRQLTQLFRRSQPAEAWALVRLWNGPLRVGLHRDMLLEAIAQAYSLSSRELEHSMEQIGEWEELARLAHRNALDSAELKPFRPAAARLMSALATAEAGLRVQLHKVGSRVSIFNNAREDITYAFADLATTMQGLPEDMVLLGGLLANPTGDNRPGEELKQRLGEAEPDLFRADPSPIELHVADVVWWNGRSCLDLPPAARFHLLETVEEWPAIIRLTPSPPRP